MDVDVPVVPRHQVEQYVDVYVNQGVYSLCQALQNIRPYLDISLKQYNKRNFYCPQILRDHCSMDQYQVDFQNLSRQRLN